jgi:hypothetical protein
MGNHIVIPLRFVKRYRHTRRKINGIWIKTAPFWPSGRIPSQEAVEQGVLSGGGLLSFPRQSVTAPVSLVDLLDGDFGHPQLATFGLTVTMVPGANNGAG